jgi:hypothetical protein
VAKQPLTQKVGNNRDTMAMEIERMLKEAELKASDCPPFPKYMRQLDGFGLPPTMLELDEENYVRWKRRCLDWILDAQILHRVQASEEMTTLSLHGIDGSRVLELIAQRCPLLDSVSLRDGTLSDDALRSLAQSVKDRLRSLDLHGTRGFTDLGVKSLAVYCEELKELRLGGCNVSDDSLEKVAKFCPKLIFVEVTANTEKITDSSLSRFSEDCTIERYDEPPPVLEEEAVSEQVEMAEDLPIQKAASRWGRLKSFAIFRRGTLPSEQRSDSRTRPRAMTMRGSVLFGGSKGPQPVTI